MKKLLALLLLAAFPAFAQAPPPPIQQGSQRLDAQTVCANGTNYNTVNTTSTATIPAGQGYFYATELQIYVVQNATASVAANLNFTTTNLNGMQWGYSTLATASQTLVISPGPVGAAPIKSSSPGTAVTVVSPAAQTNTGYAITICGYYSS